MGVFGEIKTWRFISYIIYESYAKVGNWKKVDFTIEKKYISEDHIVKDEISDHVMHQLNDRTRCVTQLGSICSGKLPFKKYICKVLYSLSRGWLHKIHDYTINILILNPNGIKRIFYWSSLFSLWFQTEMLNLSSRVVDGFWVFLKLQITADYFARDKKENW